MLNTCYIVLLMGVGISFLSEARRLSWLGSLDVSNLLNVACS